MPTQKVVAIVSGKYAEYAPLQQSAGAASAGQFVALNGAGQVDPTMLPNGTGADVQLVTASEALSAGAWVNVWSNAGAFAVRNADGSTTGKECNGYVLAAVAQGAQATVYFSGLNTAVTGQSPGPVYLGTTPGQGAAAGATAAGQTFQQIGVAASATSVKFNPQIAVARS